MQRMSQLFTKTRREAPKDEQSRNAQLLIQAGFIHKEMAGVYTYLPLGFRVFKNIEEIIREEMNALGAEEVLLTTLQDPALWQKSGRWDDAVVDNWFKSKLTSGGEVGIANTHEEPLTALLTHFVSSYKDLPLYIYQFQTKFRNELRAKSGIMRTREFMMKDLYSFSRSEEEFKQFYEQCAEAYMKIFERMGLGALTYRTFAAGGSFTTGFTDEFQTLSASGEDTIYIDTEKKIAINKEIYTDETIAQLGLDKDTMTEKKSIEVGNIFPLGTKYAEAMGLRFRDEEGNEKPVIMGSYGIGLGRLMGAVVEVFADNRGIIWPASIAPYDAHVVVLDGKEEETAHIIQELERAGIEVLYDDREDKSAGEKFADADLIGIPWRIVVSKRTVEQNQVEVKERSGGKMQLLPLDNFQFSSLNFQ
ncbi:MAG: prolyl-tRNA synthetase [Parcubacteria group bacterium Gr01-1014_29]|nr:MAG: prolyl-tRNA synthetase [Parcubacteria group bacterium Gr01-1014_29]